MSRGWEGEEPGVVVTFEMEVGVWLEVERDGNVIVASCRIDEVDVFDG